MKTILLTALLAALFIAPAQADVRLPSLPPCTGYSPKASASRVAWLRAQLDSAHSSGTKQKPAKHPQPHGAPPYPVTNAFFLIPTQHEVEQSLARTEAALKRVHQLEKQAARRPKAHR